MFEQKRDGDRQQAIYSSTLSKCNLVEEKRIILVQDKTEPLKCKDTFSPCMQIKVNFFSKSKGTTHMLVLSKSGQVLEIN